MKRYIRTKDRKISYCDSKLNNDDLLNYLNQFDNYKNQIVIIADTIEGLIEDDDLTDLGYWKDIAYKDEADITIEELYTKQGDDYILVWTKERGLI